MKVTQTKQFMIACETVTAQHEQINLINGNFIFSPAWCLFNNVIKSNDVQCGISHMDVLNDGA